METEKQREGVVYLEEFTSRKDRRFGEGLSEGARANLSEAVRFLVPVLRTRAFRAAADPPGPAQAPC